jgi:hypothetical protein
MGGENPRLAIPSPILPSDAKMTTKLGRTLAQELEKAQPADELEVVFELQPPTVPAANRENSRGEKIAIMKEAFDQCLVTLEHAVQKAGGEVTGKAWINQTVRARVPACALEELGRLESVALIDTTEPLTPESSR